MLLLRQGLRSIGSSMVRMDFEWGLGGRLRKHIYLAVTFYFFLPAVQTTYCDGSPHQTTGSTVLQTRKLLVLLMVV
jgi:hypothetical protein